MYDANALRTTLVDGLRNRLNTDQSFLEWAIIEIDERQTADEQSQGATKHQNGQGWNATDAEFGAYLARYIRGNGKRLGQRLSGSFVTKAQQMMRKYAGQILRIAAAAQPNVAA